MAKESLDRVNDTPGSSKNRMNERIRVTSATLGSNLLLLKKGNVVIVDGLKYRFNGKDALVIDKNAQKSAEIQGKKYETTISLHNLKLKLLDGKSYAPNYSVDKESLNKMSIKEIRRRVDLATKLEQNYGIETGSFLSFDELKGIKWDKELKDKLNLLKGKPYEPEDIIDVSLVNKLDINEIKRRVAIADKEGMETFFAFSNIK